MFKLVNVKTLNGHKPVLYIPNYQPHDDDDIIW